MSNVWDVSYFLFYVFTSNGAFLDKFFWLRNETRNTNFSAYLSGIDMKVLNLYIGDMDKDQLALFLFLKTQTLYFLE